MSLRWLWLFVAIPIQVLVYILYLPIVLVWRLKIYQDHKPKWEMILPIEVNEAHFAIRDGVFLKNMDDHNAFTHVWLWLHSPERFSLGLTRLSEGENLASRYLYGHRNFHKVSGDCVVFYCWAWALGQRLGALSAANLVELKTLVDSYVKRLGFRSELGDQFSVSARCANFGVSRVPDGWGKLSQPCFGPQFYTTSALLALGARHIGGRYKFYYWLHWLVFGGWLWWLAPVLYTREQKLGYVREVTMKALHTIELCGYGNWLTHYAMRWIRTHIAEKNNPLFFAMHGELPESYQLPEVINPWSYQTVELANGDELSANVFTALGTRILNKTMQQ